MKNLFLILFFLVGFAAKAQFPTQVVPTQFSTGYFKQGWHQSDSGHILTNRLPNFTPKFPGTIILHQDVGVDTTVKYWNGVRWVKLLTTIAPVSVTWGSIGGTLSNQTDLQNALNLKLNITDTSNKWITSVFRKTGTDSVFYVKGGTPTFAYKDSISSGGSGLTSVGLSLPSAFTVTNSPLTSNGVLNVIGAGTTAQYIRGNGTLATFDTTAIPSFSAKVRGLFSGTSPIIYANGQISILNANASGQKGAATFTNGDFSDNGSGTISLTSLITAGSCTSCNLTFDAKGRITLAANGSGGGGGIDSIRQRMDSVLAYDGGVGSFQFKNKNTDTTDWYNAIDWGMVGDGVTDNTVALQRLIDTIAFKQRSALIYCPDSVYVFSGVLKDTTRINSIIIFPSVAIDDKQYTITIRGKRKLTYSPSAFISSVPFPDGTIFRCTNNNRKGVEPSFMGGKGPVGGDYAETSYMVPGLEELNIQMPANSLLTAVNHRHFTNSYLKDVNIVAGTSQSVLDKPEPTDSTVYGFIQPDYSHGINQIVDGTLNISGFYYGMRLGEGALVRNYGSYGNKIAVAVDGADGTMIIERMIVGWNQFGFRARTGYTPSSVRVYSCNTERWVAPAWYTFVADVYDPDNQLYSDIDSRTVIAGSGTDSVTACLFTKVGGNNVHQHCQGKGTLPYADTLSSNTSVSLIDVTNTSSGSSAAIQTAFRNNANSTYSAGLTGGSYSSSLILADQAYYYNNGANGFRWISDNNSGSMSWIIGSGSTTPKMTLTAAGRLGVGTTSPAEVFHAVINSNVAGALRFDNLNAGSSANAGIRLQSNAGDAYMYRTSTAYGSGLGNTFVIQSTGSADIVFFGAGETARFKSNGNVLVGTSTDGGEKFQVTGSVALDLGSDATGDTYYRNSGGTFTRLGIGTTNQVMTVISGVPSWQNASSSTTLYTGDGTLAGNRTVTGGSNSLTFTGINNFRVYASTLWQAKADGSWAYASAIDPGSSGRQSWQFAYLPFSRGLALYVDTLNNVGLGDNSLTTMPLYTRGNSVLINGLQSLHGNFYQITNVTGNATATIESYFYTIDATSGSITITLPAASAAFGGGMGIQYVFKRIDNSGNTITIQRATSPGTDTIDGGTSFTLTTQYETKELQCGSTSAWYIK